MYTIELDFDPDEEFLKDMNTFIGVHDPVKLEEGYNGTVEDFLNKYLEKGPENYMKVVGTDSDEKPNYENFKAVQPSSAELYEGKGTDIPGIAPIYLSDMEKINTFLGKNKDPDRITPSYMTVPEIAKRDYETKTEAIEDQASDLQERWPELTWTETDNDTITNWTYRKGEVEILSGEIREKIEGDDLNQEEAIKYVMSEAPFEDEREFKEAKNNALAAASLKRKTGREQQLINEIEQLGIPASRKDSI